MKKKMYEIFLDKSDDPLMATWNKLPKCLKFIGDCLASNMKIKSVRIYKKDKLFLTINRK